MIPRLERSASAVLILAAGLWQSTQVGAQEPVPGINHPAELTLNDAALVQPQRTVDSVEPNPRARGCICGGRTGFFAWRKHTAACKRHWQEHFLGYPEEFNEWPLGSSLYAHERTQVANAKVANLTFYDYDFVNESAVLNAKGRQKLSRVMQELPRSFNPIIVEQTAYAPGLDQARRQMLFTELANGAFPVPPERIMVGPPISVGLSGAEAELQYVNQIGGAGGSSSMRSSSSNSGFNGGFDSGGLSGPARSRVP